ncbi:hypothetical protein [Clostridium cellulovorans]|uniref:Uncharacterized protein n=1 Tax=Clostridium cellulovorans (strain ATCC 35296 / DSM 3052 / OCM 3 / 743B) TaxID=573061 RepID=D9SPT7_CLOC7|nr:hypothetical protein [Clostridium cellulovorans]ADL52073.1 hypothetical protein Clocel_2357 [Clostridium cellulovorans 743B]
MKTKDILIRQEQLLKEVDFLAEAHTQNERKITQTSVTKIEDKHKI